MALTRNDRSRDEQIGLSVQAWTIGRPLLSLHANIFVLAAVGLILLNLYRSPGELWVQWPLLFWGFLLIVHAGLVGLGWATKANFQGVKRNGQHQDHAPAPAPQTPAEREPARSRFRPPVSATLSELRPHQAIRIGRWSLSRSAFRPPIAGAAASARQAGADLRARAKPAETTGLAHASDFAQRARSVAGALLSRLPSLNQDDPSSPPAGRAFPPSPRNGATPERRSPGRTPTSNGFTTPAGFAPLRETGPHPTFTPTDSHAPQEQPHPSSFINDAAIHQEPPRTAPSWATGLGTPEPPARAKADSDQAPDSDLPKETEWTWMEAAAAAWLARRTDADPPPRPPRQTAPTPAEDIVIPEPPRDDAHP